MRMKIGYGLVAALIIAVTTGSAVYGMSQHGKPKIVTKTKTVYRNAKFDGSPEALARYLNPEQAQEIQCPKQSESDRCFVFASRSFAISAVISAGEAG